MEHNIKTTLIAYINDDDGDDDGGGGGGVEVFFRETRICFSVLITPARVQLQ